MHRLPSLYLSEPASDKWAIVMRRIGLQLNYHTIPYLASKSDLLNDKKVIGFNLPFKKFFLLKKCIQFYVFETSTKNSVDTHNSFWTIDSSKYYNIIN